MRRNMYLRYLLWGLLVALGLYGIYELVYTGKQDRALKQENEYLQEHYDNLLERSFLVDDVLKGLQARDNQIYHNIFNVDPPSQEGLFASGDEIELEKFFAADEEHLVKSSHEALEGLVRTASQVERQIRAINDCLEDKDFNKENFPSVIPLENLTIARTGATTGKKINPFFKTFASHAGIDLMAPYGTDVIATGGGVVVEVLKQNKGLGNMVIIDHGDGLRTTYAHLSDIYVAINQRVKRGKVIGRVGNSGTSFSTSLHYEVRKGGRALDPVNYFFANLSPSAYSDMLLLANTTGQSLD
ncbi:MAG: M23 family metallopeptidase [Bacteroidales bacterium]|nr:M23 family metallopeptidase [Bacteroidales bacterium]